MWEQAGVIKFTLKYFIWQNSWDKDFRNHWLCILIAQATANEMRKQSVKGVPQKAE